MSTAHTSLDKWERIQWFLTLLAMAFSLVTFYLRKRAEDLRFKVMLMSNANDTQFDDETTALLTTAALQAYSRGDDAVDCEHVLAAAVNAGILMTYQGVRKHPNVQRIVNSHFDKRAMRSGSAVPYSERVGRALLEARKAAVERGSPIVTPDDLLVGIAKTGRSRAARALKAAGVLIESPPATILPELPGPDR